MKQSIPLNRSDFKGDSLIVVVMEGKLYYDYKLVQWVVFIVCYGVFFFFGAIESSESIYYSLMKSELEIPYRIQGWLVSMGSYSFILGSPIVGYLMTLVDVKPILILGFSFYIAAYLLLYFFKQLGIVFVSLFIEGIGAVLLDVGMNTLSTVLFPKHRGVMMNSLHFFYGAGCVLGPAYSSRIFLVLKQGYRGIFLGLIAFAVIGFLLTVFTRLSLRVDSSAERLIEEEVVGDVESVKLVGDVESVKVVDDVESVKVVDDVESVKVVDDVESVKVADIIESVKVATNTESVKVTDVVDSSSPSVQTESTAKPLPANEQPSEKTPLTLWRSFITPMVWLLGVNMGAVYGIESVTVNWGPLYLKEKFGMLPEHEGTRFVSLFYVFYTLARLVTGFAVDWLGDALGMLAFNVLLVLLYIVAFSLQRRGVWLLAFSGFLISPFYPTSITVPMEVFGGDTKNTISVILCIALVVNALIQVVIGYVDEYVGPQWGYPLLSLSMCAVMILCMIVTQLYLKLREKRSA